LQGGLFVLKCKRDEKAFYINFSFFCSRSSYLRFLGKWIGWAEIGKAFSEFTLEQAAIIILLTFLIVYLGTLRWKIILNSDGIPISLFELFKIYLGGYAIMYMFPTVLMAGEAFRVYGLAKKKKLNWSKTASSVIVERILEWTINLSVVVLGLCFFISGKEWLWSKQLLFIFGGAFLFFALILIYFYSHLLNKKALFMRLLKDLAVRKLARIAVS